MKKGVFRILVALALLCFAGVPVLRAATVDRIVAIVGNEIVLQSEIEQQAVMTELQYPEMAKAKDLRGRILDNLVMQKIVLTKARLDSVNVNESDIDKQTDERLMFLRSRFPSIEEMEKTFSKSYAMIEKEIKDDIRNQQLIDNLRRQKMSGVTVSYDEVEDFYRQHRDELPSIPESVQISQIIMYPQVTPENKAKARSLIEDVQQRLLEGADFDEMARRYSQDPGSAEVGGDLGYSKRGEFVKPYEEAAFSLKDGEISAIVESRFGYHIIQLLEKEGDRVHTRHILAVFDRTTLDRDAAKEKLEEIRSDVLAGKATFAEMASTYSEDPLSSLNGGMIQQADGEGLFPSASLKEPLKSVVAKLDEPGAISKPMLINAPEGEPFYALFRLDKRIRSHAMGLSTDYARLEKLAIDEKQKVMFTTWIEGLKKEVYVNILDSDI
ncbi:MAG: peptidylprolyl isomerase [Prosthecochloris sp.]|uniref:SurA domain n=1 Tax=Prosthecochloris aestuarii (strain DSM 271 / SK 413) TaxID=290512 RepID=B4S948_PROA2|nr:MULTISPECIES: peptidylprolyl isomerase [Prosthecochloris]ACF45080.1 SurA domain [Prosthecochloris aestuarii DSM 271]MCW8798554.1 peptidylprolyl isomerase [Prosthecochloris sp.]NEX12229.1 peptidylprolyl isomerase [Prosthecochloris sp.]